MQMLESKKKSIYQTLHIPFQNLSLMDHKQNFVLDRSTICADWYCLWSSFGFSEYQWISRAAKVEEYTRKLLEDKLLAYKEQLHKREELLKETLEDYEDLLERTGLSSSIESSIFEKLKLKDQEIYLDKKMQELLINEEQLIHRRNELEHKQKQLCCLLNTSPIELNLSLSLLQINQKLQDHIKMLTDLKEQRLIQISSYYLKLKEYSEELEWTPSSPSSTVEYLLLEQFDRCLSVTALDEIERTIRELENQIELQKVKFSTLHNQLSHLYKRLNKDYCLAYKTGSDNINAFVIKQLEHEIACCRAERMRNGKEYCQFIHQQIIELIEKAYLDDRERIIVNKLDFESLSPDLLDAYDTEFERITKLYEKRKPVLDAYEKWLAFWNEFVAFTKTSTDPGRFHVRGYNAEIEARQRKKFQRELPLIEQEFLNILSENNEPIFLVNNVPIRQKFDEAHQQIPATAMPMNTPGRTPSTSRFLALTPVRTRTPITTPRRVVNKEPFLLGTAITNTARRAVKTPASTVARKLLHKVTSQTEDQPVRAKPGPPPPPPPEPLLQASPPHLLPKVSDQSQTRTDDQSLDFSLLHTIKNVYGQIKVMTSTPNSSFMPMQTPHIKTAHNTIGQRKSKRRSKRTPLPLLTVQDTNDETIVCL